MELLMGSKPQEKKNHFFAIFATSSALFKLCDLCVDAAVLADKGQTLTYHSDAFR